MAYEVKQYLYPASGRADYSSVTYGALTEVSTSTPVPAENFSGIDKYSLVGTTGVNGVATIGVEWAGVDACSYAGVISSVRVIVRVKCSSQTGLVYLWPSINQADDWSASRSRVDTDTYSFVFSLESYPGGGAWTMARVNGQSWGWKAELTAISANPIAVEVSEFRVEVMGEIDAPSPPTLPPTLSLGTRFALHADNWAETSDSFATTGYPKICNYNDDAAYPGASEAVEDNDYPMQSLLAGDRYTIWRPGTSPPSSIVVEIDLGAGRTVNTLGVVGAHYYTSGTTPMAVEFKYITAEHGWPSEWQEFENPSAYLVAADMLLFQPHSVPDVRWVQVTLTGCSAAMQWSISGIYAGVSSELGLWYSAGRTDSDIAPRSKVRTVGGSPYVTSYGPHYKIIKLPFKTILTATKDALVAAAQSDEPFLISLPTGEVYEGMVPGDSFDVSHIFGSGTVGLWDVNLEFEVLA
jgi:hypothetical protein